MIDEARIRELLDGRRWFAGDLADIEVVAEHKLQADPSFMQVLVRSGEHTYQLIVDGDGNEIDDNPNAAYALLEEVAPDEAPQSVRRLGLEQSNTTFVFDERILCKLYRKVVEGPNPDVDVPQALREVGFAYVPEILARWRRDNRDLAAVQPFLSGANDGWSLALASLRQLFAEGISPEDAGGDFAFEARRLGAITAELHVAMSQAFGAERARRTAPGRARRRWGSGAQTQGDRRRRRPDSRARRFPPRPGVAHRRVVVRRGFRGRTGAGRGERDWRPHHH